MACTEGGQLLGDDFDADFEQNKGWYAWQMTKNYMEMDCLASESTSKKRL